MSIVTTISNLIIRKGGIVSAVSPNSLNVSYESFVNSLTWDNSVADTFELEVASMPDYSDAATIFTGYALFYDHSPVDLGETYYYRIRGFLSGNPAPTYATTSVDTAPSDGTSGSQVYYFGDSITVGVGASSTPNRWTSLLSVNKSWTENNFGHSGYTITPNGCRPNWNQSEIPTKTNSLRYMFIAFGVNDAFMNPSVTPTNYQQNIEDAISAALSDGWNKDRIIIISPFYTTFDGDDPNYCGSSLSGEVRKLLFVSAAQAAANTHGTNYTDMFTYMKDNGGASLLADEIHPNNAGHALIATRLGTLINT